MNPRRFAPVILLVVTGCRSSAQDSGPTISSSSATVVPSSSTSAAARLPAAAPHGGLGMCAPSSEQSCGEWCSEHGTLESECVPCKQRAAGGK